MSLLFMDGFELYPPGLGITGQNAMKLGRWDPTGWTSGASSGIVSGGPFGTGQYYSLRETSNGRASATVSNTAATLICGFAYRCSVLGGNLLLFNVDAVTQCSLRHNADGSVQFQRSTNVLVGSPSAAGVITTNTWAYIEVKFTVNDTTGSFEIRVNGITVASGSGLDTKNTTQDFANRIIFQPIGTNIIDFDDLYICNTAGSVNNDFLGPFRVELLLPDAEGAVNDFTPSAGSDNSANVDEASADGDTTYNASSTSGHKDLYSFSAPAAIGTPVALSVISYARKTDAKPFSFQMMQGPDDAFSHTFQAAIDYSYQFELTEAQPGGGAWDAASIASEFGVVIL